ncbi:MAG: parB-like partition protein [Marinobacter sp. T13-3]|nr:MAG: parB-like partition protein [Marinobacter sp. T13-3]
MSNKARGHGAFASVAKKASDSKKARRQVVAPDEYEDGDKVFAGSSAPSPSPSSIKPSAAADDGLAHQTSGTLIPDNTFKVVDSHLVRSWTLKDRRLEELDRDPKYAELVESARVAGIIEPLVVRQIPGKDPDGVMFEEIAGFKRLNAAQAVGAPVPILIRHLTDQQALVIQAQENRGRSEPCAWSQALHYEHLLASGTYSTARQVADVFGIDKSSMSMYLKIARQMPADFKASLFLDTLAQRSLRALIEGLEGCGTDPKRRETYIDRIVEHADQINATPDNAVKIVDRVLHEVCSGAKAPKASKPRVFQSQKGKALSMRTSGSGLAVTFHRAALAVADEDELTSVLKDYLENKGLALEQK